MYQAKLYSGLTILSRPANWRAAVGLVIMMIMNHFGDRHDDDIKDTEVRSQKKNNIIWEFFPTWGGVFPNPKTFVNLPSIFLYAKFILRC